MSISIVGVCMYVATQLGQVHNGQHMIMFSTCRC